MNAFKKFLAGRGVGYYLSLCAVICGIVAGITYMATGVTSFNPDLNGCTVGCVWAAVVLCAITAVFDFKDVRYVAAMLYLYGFMWFIYAQVTYIANVFVAIDGYGFTAGFIVTFVFFLLSFVLALLAGILSGWRPWAKAQESRTEVKDETV